MTRSTKMTAAEIAAFKAANLAANARNKKTVVVMPKAPALNKSQRQQFTEDLRETEDMIRAAKRQGLLGALPALIARHELLTQHVNHAALS
jgi:hypothetical protein